MSPTTASQVRGPASTVAEIADSLRDAQQLIVASHENPDGDAIGSARAMQLILEAVGHDVIVYIPGAVVPKEYEAIRPTRLTGEIPADVATRTLICVDCGNESRLANASLLASAARVINIDHHADNTHFGALNLIRGDVPCSTLLVRDLARELDVALTPEIATAIYIGLVTDTGRFQYSNTNADSFRLAAELVEAGVDVHDVFRSVYESVEYPRLKLLARGLEHACRYLDGRVVTTHLSRADFAESDANDDDAEGVVDYLRGVEGTYVAVFVRDLPDGSVRARKGSLRTTRDDIDVSAIARTWNGGGHRQAAGFSTDDDMQQITERVCAALEAQLDS